MKHLFHYLIYDTYSSKFQIIMNNRNRSQKGRVFESSFPPMFFVLTFLWMLNEFLIYFMYSNLSRIADKIQDDFKTFIFISSWEREEITKMAFFKSQQRLSHSNYFISSFQIIQ